MRTKLLEDYGETNTGRVRTLGNTVVGDIPDIFQEGLFGKTMSVIGEARSGGDCVKSLGRLQATGANSSCGRFIGSAELVAAFP